MTFIAELEDQIQSIYSKILEKNHRGVPGKTLNCASFKDITNEIKSVLVKEQNKGSDAIEIANNIIFKILQGDFFAYENHEMAMLIGYIYLKRQGVTIKKYSVKGINNNSTLDEIRMLTESWR